MSAAALRSCRSSRCSMSTRRAARDSTARAGLVLKEAFVPRNVLRKLVMRSTCKNSEKARSKNTRQRLRHPLVAPAGGAEYTLLRPAIHARAGGAPLLAGKAHYKKAPPVLPGERGRSRGSLECPLTPS